MVNVEKETKTVSEEIELKAMNGMACMIMNIIAVAACFAADRRVTCLLCHNSV